MPVDAAAPEAGADHEGWRPGPRVAGADGVEVATWDLGGSGPPLLLLHATGFHARMWLPLAPGLRERHRLWAVDLRGHGASGHAADLSYRDWGRFVDDIVEVVETLQLGDAATGLAAAGHSLGGGVLLMVEQRRPGTFRTLYLYEPIAPPPVQRRPGEGVDLSRVARKRRARFASRAEARANFAAKLPFARFRADALDAYIAHAFSDDPGGVFLSCSPDEEASVYEGAMLHGAWDRLAEVRAPVVLAAGGDASPPARFTGPMAERLPTARVERYDELTHFGPMEDPDAIAAAIATALST